MSCCPPHLSQLLILLRDVKTDELVVKTIAEKTHGATPRWLHVVSDRSMLDPCGVMAGNFEDMSSENKYAALAAALQKGESSAKNCEHKLREGGVDESEPADEVPIETPMQSQMSDGSEAQPNQGGKNPSRLADVPHHMHRENVLRVRCVGEPLMTAEGMAEGTPMPSQLSDGIKAQPFEAPAAEIQQP